MFRNHLAFENLPFHPWYLNGYVIIMSHLVDTQKDADLLIQNEIIALGSLSTAFHSLIKRLF